MNEFFSTLGRRWAEHAKRQGASIVAPELDPQVAEEILQLARVVAHAKERSFAPLASFTAGIAAERLRVAKGSGPTEVATYLREVREELEADAGG